MATLRDYFDTDFSNYLAAHQESTVTLATAEQIVITVRLLLSHEANAYFGAFYVPATVDAAMVCAYLVQHPELVTVIRDAVYVETVLPDAERPMRSSDTLFSKRLFVYAENQLTEEELERLLVTAASAGILLHYRGPTYVAVRSRNERPLAFISHDSRDKDELARPLALALVKLHCPVWFDEFSLKVGDSLRESIEKGLRQCPKCVLVVTPRFLANEGWTKQEFNAVFTRELVERQKVILPVWHSVTQAQVFEYSPTLADRKAVLWTGGADSVAEQLRRALAG